ncbi:hypothetical protein, partial [Salinicola sp. CPA57]|uniref:hypothetical protein n=1 Tax=Salinicola sp. CPA57 TaxID=1949080 RepID=UPI001E5EC802
LEHDALTKTDKRDDGKAGASISPPLDGVERGIDQRPALQVPSPSHYTVSFQHVRSLRLFTKPFH